MKSNQMIFACAILCVHENLNEDEAEIGEKEKKKRESRWNGRELRRSLGSSRNAF